MRGLLSIEKHASLLPYLQQKLQEQEVCFSFNMNVDSTGCITSNMLFE
jgi:hypothetical protein